MDTTQLEGIIAFFVPLLVSVLKKTSYSATINALIAIAVYVVAGVAAVFASGQPIDLTNITGTVALFTGTGTIAYTLFWKNWGDPQITAKVNG